VSTYVDSGVLVKLFVSEANSPAAARAIARLSTVRLNSLQELEVRNTFRALEGRGLITATQRAAADHTLDEDIVARRFRRTAPDWTRVFPVAIKLCDDHTRKTLARSLDILHVAIALVDGSKVLVTGDARQAAVAKRAGLEVKVIE
jgi:predicted nucleic acid-binding protein